MRTPEIVERLEAERLGDVNVKLMSLISNNVGMVLTGRNQVKILQDADNSYPELLAVTEAAYAAALAWLEVGTGQRGADEPVPVGNEVS